MSRQSDNRVMDVFNKIKSVVSSALPVGNPITNEFEIQGHRASGGPGLLWKIYDAVQKSTKQEASVFLFEKKTLERFSKSDREVLLEVLKRGVSQLTRLRHPKILSVLHPLEDSRESLAFATEPVFSSLSNLLGYHDNIPVPAPPQFKEFKFYDVEIKYGLLQVLDGLNFLHSSARIVHGNICPDSVFVNKTGCWKLAGFEFCIVNTNQQGLQPYYACREWDGHLTPVAQARLNYMAPEYGMSGSCDTSSDMFSVGMLIYTLHYSGKTLYDTLDDWTTFKKNAEQIKSLGVSKLSGVPDGVRDHVKMLLNTEPAVRPDVDQLTKIPFFEDVGAMTLQYLDMLVQKDNLQKSQFFKGLPAIISNLPKRVNIQRVLPSLSKECVNNNNMVPFVLPCLLQIAESATEQEYTTHILPALIPLFKIKEPIQVMLIFLQNMSLLLNKTPQADIRNHILPMITRALEAGVPQMQELCLNIIPTFAELIEYTSLKNSIVPRIKKLCVGAPTLSIRVNCLVCMGKLLEHLDKWYVLDEVLPILLEIPSREPAVLMSVLGVLRVMLTHKKLGITKELLANKVIPFIFPLCIDNGLNLAQFNAFIATVKDMVSRVESEQRTKLEQLNAVQSEQRTLQKFAEEAVSGGGANGTDKAKPVSSTSMMEGFLSDFGMGGGGLKNSSSLSGLADLMDKPSPSPTPSTNNNSSPAHKKTGGAGLTMSEKEKLAKDQELQRQLKGQPTLLPSAPPSSVRGGGATDLSHTLMSGGGGMKVPPSNNLQSMNLSSLDSILPSMSNNKPSLNQIRPAAQNSYPAAGSAMGSSYQGMGTAGSAMGSSFQGMGTAGPAMGSSFQGMGTAGPAMGSNYQGLGTAGPTMGGSFQGMGPANPAMRSTGPSGFSTFPAQTGNPFQMSGAPPQARPAWGGGGGMAPFNTLNPSMQQQQQQQTKSLSSKDIDDLLG